MNNKTLFSRKFGFSLLEMTIVLLVVSVVTTAILKLSYQETLAQKNVQAEQVLKIAKQQLKGFYSVNGFFPCPDVDGDGKEDRKVLNQCQNSQGLLPFLDLFIEESMLAGKRLYWHLPKAVTVEQISWSTPVTDFDAGNLKKHYLTLCLDETCLERRVNAVGIVLAMDVECVEANDLENKNCDGDEKFFKRIFSLGGLNTFRHRMEYLTLYELPLD